MSSLPKNAVLSTFYGSHQASPWRDQGEMSILLKRIWVWASEEAHKAQTWRQEITRQSRLCEFFINLVRSLDDFTILGFQEIQNLVDRNSGLKMCSMTPHSYLATRGRACSLKLSYCNQIKYQIESIDSSSYLLGIECYFKWSELFPEISMMIGSEQETTQNQSGFFSPSPTCNPSWLDEASLSTLFTRETISFPYSFTVENI